MMLAGRSIENKCLFMLLGATGSEEMNIAQLWVHKKMLLNNIDGVSCVKPKGALYLFPKLDTDRFNVQDDEQFVLDFLLAERVLMVQGTGFHWPKPDHFRVVFLPHLEQLRESMGRLERFLASYRQ